MLAELRSPLLLPPPLSEAHHPDVCLLALPDRNTIMSDLLDTVWRETASITVHYKLYTADFIHCVQLTPEAYFNLADDGITRTAKHLHASAHLPVAQDWLEWTRLEERNETGKILRSMVTKFWDDGNAWICQIRIYRPYTPLV